MVDAFGALRDVPHIGISMVKLAWEAVTIKLLPLDTTVSVGVSAGMIAGQTLGDLLERSDAALYLAKAQGRNRVHRASQPGPEGGPSTLIRVA